MQPKVPLRLHLGCGERYFDGYVNIDFPPAEHTVQQRSVADQHSDLLTLRYPAGTVDEVRLHHVFEHFPRQIACALLAAWQTWIKPAGMLRIEVPDFARTAIAAINPLRNARSRLVAERHLFGSHEAAWAAHKEAYSAGSLGRLMEDFGFVTRDVTRNSWRGTYNVDITAVKNTSLSRQECDAAARSYLRQYLIDDSVTEIRLLDTWLEQYSRQADACWSLGG
jgi:predicted SAM-dependent methyltransferase